MLAEPSGQGVHARRLAVRAQARRLPAHRQQVARRSAAAHAQRQRLHGGLSRDRARDQGAAVRRLHRRRRSRRDRRAGQAELLAAAAARPPDVAARHQRARPSSCRRRSSRSISSRSRTSTFGRCRSSARKALLLMAALPKLGAVRALDHIEREGEAFLAQVHRARSRGHHRQAGRRAVSRRAHATLAQDQGRDRTGDFVIVGFTAPKGSRSSTSARCSSPTWSTDELVYAGRVGTGFNDALLAELKALLDPIVRTRAAVRTAARREAPQQIPETKTTTWVDPVYVCEVRFREWTPDGVLRHATFLRMRHDKKPRECERQGVGRRCRRRRRRARSTAAEPRRRRASPTGAAAKPAGEKTVAFSNLKKVYWPADGVHEGRSHRLLPRDLAVDVCRISRIGRW